MQDLSNALSRRDPVRTAHIKSVLISADGDNGECIVEGSKFTIRGQVCFVAAQCSLASEGARFYCIHRYEIL